MISKSHTKVASQCRRSGNEDAGPALSGWAPAQGKRAMLNNVIIHIVQAIRRYQGPKAPIPTQSVTFGRYRTHQVQLVLECRAAIAEKERPSHHTLSSGQLSSETHTSTRPTLKHVTELSSSLMSWYPNPLSRIHWLSIYWTLRLYHESHTEIGPWKEYFLSKFISQQISRRFDPARSSVDADWLLLSTKLLC